MDQRFGSEQWYPPLLVNFLGSLSQCLSLMAPDTCLACRVYIVYACLVIQTGHVSSVHFPCILIQYHLSLSLQECHISLFPDLRMSGV